MAGDFTGDLLSCELKSPASSLRMFSRSVVSELRDASSKSVVLDVTDVSSYLSAVNEPKKKKCYLVDSICLLKVLELKEVFQQLIVGHRYFQYFNKQKERKKGKGDT